MRLSADLTCQETLQIKSTKTTIVFWTRQRESGCLGLQTGSQSGTNVKVQVVHCFPERRLQHNLCCLRRRDRRLPCECNMQPPQTRQPHAHRTHDAKHLLGLIGMRLCWFRLHCGVCASVAPSCGLQRNVTNHMRWFNSDKDQIERKFCLFVPELTEIVTDDGGSDQIGIFMYMHTSYLIRRPTGSLRDNKIHIVLNEKLSLNG